MADVAGAVAKKEPTTERRLVGGAMLINGKLQPRGRVVPLTEKQLEGLPKRYTADPKNPWPPKSEGKKGRVSNNQPPPRAVDDDEDDD